MLGLEILDGFVNWSTMLVEAVFESSVSPMFHLCIAVVALYHVNDVFGVTVNAY